jgi:hypothetical protein
MTGGYSVLLFTKILVWFIFFFLFLLVNGKIIILLFARICDLFHFLFPFLLLLFRWEDFEFLIVDLSDLFLFIFVPFF